MSTLHKVSQAGLLAALDNQSDEVKESIIFNHAVTGNWSGYGRIDLPQRHPSQMQLPSICNLALMSLDQ